MASRKLNPRYDHWCRIYRPTGGDELTDSTGEEVLYEGKCLIYEANNLRSYKEKDAYKEDMGCDIPSYRGYDREVVASQETEDRIRSIRQGDLIDFDRYGARAVGMTINTAKPSAMGHTFMFNNPKV